MRGETSSTEKLQRPTEGWEQLRKKGHEPGSSQPLFLLTLISSSAILIYLSSKYQTADHWYPSDLQARARVHEYLGWHADCIRGTFGVPLWTQVRRAV